VNTYLAKELGWRVSDIQYSEIKSGKEIFYVYHSSLECGEGVCTQVVFHPQNTNLKYIGKIEGHIDSARIADVNKLIIESTQRPYGKTGIELKSTNEFSTATQK
jgi:hypothetical protein